MSDVLASRLGIVGVTYASLVPLLSFSYTTEKKNMSENKSVILIGAVKNIKEYSNNE